jgi:hypothetical protein
VAEEISHSLRDRALKMFVVYVLTNETFAGFRMQELPKEPPPGLEN